MKIPPLLVYTVLRLSFFLVPFGVMMLFPIFRTSPWNWIAAVCATLIGLSLSVIFLRRPLGEASASISARRERRPGKQTPGDEDIEDRAIADADDAAREA